MRDLARRLLASCPSCADAQVQDASRVFEALRLSLTRFAGAEGFASLMRRALSMARAEMPALNRVKVSDDGRLEGLDQAPGDAEAIALIAHLLLLLFTFIGEPLTLILVGEVCPNLSQQDKD